MDIRVLLRRVIEGDEDGFKINQSPGNGDVLNFNNIKLKGYFSLDVTRSIRFDTSKLRWVDPKLPNKIEKLEKIINLQNGSKTVIKKNISFTDEHLDNILKWIQMNNDKINNTENYAQ